MLAVFSNSYCFCLWIPSLAITCNVLQAISPLQFKTAVIKPLCFHSTSLSLHNLQYNHLCFLCCSKISTWPPIKSFLEFLFPEVKPVFTLWKVFNLMFCLRCTSSTSAVIREILLHFPIIAGEVCSTSKSSSSYKPWQINFLGSLGFFGKKKKVMEAVKPPTKVKSRAV